MPAAEDVTETLSVLVVDDEPSVVEHLCAGLELRGFRTRSASSAAEVLPLLRSDPGIGVVMTDIRMPGQDGLSLAQDILQGTRSGSPIQVVLISGHATIDHATAAVRLGVSDMLLKPFRLIDAVTAVEKAMQAARTERAAVRERAAEAARLSALEQDRDTLVARLDEAVARLGQAEGSDTGLRERIRHEAQAISHALRTPLNAIAGGADLISYTGAGAGEGNLELVRDGVQAAIRAVELVEELYQAEQAPGPAAGGRVALPDALRDVGALLAEQIAEKGLSLVTGELERVPELPAAAEVVRRILSHALVATIDWSERGSRIAVSLRHVRQDGAAWAVVVIASAAPGIELPAWDGLHADARGTALSRTQEDLHFAIARRLAGHIGGRVASWNEGGRAMAIQVVLPVGTPAETGAAPA